MVFSVLKKAVMFVPNKLTAINNSINKIVDFPNAADRTFTFVSKCTGVTTGAAGAAKGSVDFLEAVACQDGICAFVSGVGVVADGLQICTSFIPGPNVSVIVTMPLSIGYWM